MVILFVKSFNFAALNGLAPFVPHQVYALGSKHLFNTNDLTFGKDGNSAILNALFEFFVRHQARTNPLVVFSFSLYRWHYHLALVEDLPRGYQVAANDLLPLREHWLALDVVLLLQQVVDFLKFEGGHLAEKLELL